MCDIVVLLSLGSEEGPEIIRVLLVYKQFISLHTKWLLQEQDVSQGHNFALVMGAYCNWQPSRLPNHWSGFEPRRLHHSLMLVQFDLLVVV
jgi:hypothetical protein